MDIITISLDAMDAYLDVCRLQVISLGSLDTHTLLVEVTLRQEHAAS